MKIKLGDEILECTTRTEIVLAGTLKAVLSYYGGPPSLNHYIKEFRMRRFGIEDSMKRFEGTVFIYTDGNNGEDVVVLERE